MQGCRSRWGQNWGWDAACHLMGPFAESGGHTLSPCSPLEHWVGGVRWLPSCPQASLNCCLQASRPGKSGALGGDILSCERQGRCLGKANPSGPSSNQVGSESKKGWGAACWPLGGAVSGDKPIHLLPPPHR